MTEQGIRLRKKLDQPLSFLGEDRSKYVRLDGEKVPIEEIIGSGNRIGSLKERLREITDILGSGEASQYEEEELYREGMGIKYALHVLRKNDKDGAHSTTDTRRWLDYGKRIR